MSWDLVLRFVGNEVHWMAPSIISIIGIYVSLASSVDVSDKRSQKHTPKTNIGEFLSKDSTYYFSIALFLINCFIVVLGAPNGFKHIAWFVFIVIIFFTSCDLCNQYQQFSMEKRAGTSDYREDKRLNYRNMIRYTPLFMAILFFFIGAVCSLMQFMKSADPPVNIKNVSTIDSPSETIPSEPFDQEDPLQDWKKMNSPEIKDVVFFGDYMQSINTEQKEKIAWTVLAKEAGKVLIISNKCIDCRRFNEEEGSVNWEKSSIRDWLNNEFFQEAFNSEEQGKIVLTKVKAEINSLNNTIYPGGDTEDRVFLLSISEVEQYFSEDVERMAFPTEYTIGKGAGQDSDLEGGPGWWWLRTPGDEKSKIADVMSTGEINRNGIEANRADCVIRPAMWVTLPS